MKGMAGDDSRGISVREAIEQELVHMTHAIEESFEAAEIDLEAALEPLTLLLKVQTCLVVEQSDFRIRYRRYTGYLSLMWEATQDMHLSRLLALSFRYGLAEAILRLAVELILQGAFTILLADEDYRKDAKILDKRVEIEEDGVKFKITLREVFEVAFESGVIAPSKLEEVSGGLFDLITPLQENTQLYKLLPSVKKIIRELRFGGYLSPIPKSEVYSLYQGLSHSIHGVISATDLGRETMRGKGMFKPPSFKQHDLNEFVEHFQKVLDIGLVLTVNVLGKGFRDSTLGEILGDVLAEIDSDKVSLPYFMKQCKTIRE